jgi:glycosyltransferase involved in cell wall biosynthesis
MSAAVAGVIGAFNQVAYVEEAVRSLRAEVDELVVVDDGSTDGTAELVASLARELHFAVLRTPEPGGVSAAYNTAIAQVEAPIVLIQGGDDRTLPGRGAASVLALSDPNVMLTYSLPVVIDGRGRVLPDELIGEFEAGREVEDHLGHLFRVGNYLCAPSVAVRTVDYLGSGGFPTSIDLLQDYALWLELAARGDFHRAGEAYVAYRKHGTNLSREYVGVDSPRQRRYSAELQWIRNRFLDGLGGRPLATLAERAAVDAIGLSDAELRTAIRIGSRDRGLVRRGLDEVWDMVNIDPGALTKLRLDRRDLDRLASFADHENLEALGRVRAIGRALGAVSGEVAEGAIER